MDLVRAGEGAARAAVGRDQPRRQRARHPRRRARARGDEQGPRRARSRPAASARISSSASTSSRSASPALRERVEDIRPLADAFMAAFCKENGLKPKTHRRRRVRRARAPQLAGQRARAEERRRARGDPLRRRRHDRRPARGSAREPVRRRRPTDADGRRGRRGATRAARRPRPSPTARARRPGQRASRCASSAIAAERHYIVDMLQSSTGTSRARRSSSASSARTCTRRSARTASADRDGDQCPGAKGAMMSATFFASAGAPAPPRAAASRSTGSATKIANETYS